MSSLPAVNVSEVWGEGPLYPNRCWLIHWPLSESQAMCINKSIIDTVFWEDVLSLASKLNISVSCSWRIERAEKIDSIYQDLIVSFVESLVSPSSCKICGLSQKLAARGVCFALEGIHHEILGDVIKFSVRLLRECISRSLQGCTSNFAPVFLNDCNRVVQLFKRRFSNELTESLLSEVSRRKISCFLVEGSSQTYQFGEGVYGRLCRNSSNDSDSHFGAMFANDKSFSHNLLTNLGFPVPKQIQFNGDVSDEYIEQMVKKIGFPCVVKPVDCERGDGVTASIQTLERLKQAIAIAKKSVHQSSLLLQKHIDGIDYRVVVYGGTIAFVVKRSPPVIVGTGSNTVNECIDILNADRRKRRSSDGVSTELDRDDPEVAYYLASVGLDFKSVVAKGQIVPLRGSSNVSKGALREEISPDSIHPRIASQCLSIASTIRLDCCGIDYICRDISFDPICHPGVFIEVNSMPQHSPKRAKNLIQNLFPDGSLDAIDCTLIVLNIGRKLDESIDLILRKLILENQRMTLACPSVLRDKLEKIVPESLRSYIRYFGHPKELMIDRSVSELACLMTPDLLLKKGWIIPRCRLKVINLIKPSQSLASKIVFQYLV